MANSDGLTHITTVTMTGTATHNIDSVFDTTYDNYRLMIYVDPAANINVTSQLRVGGVSNSTANSYQFQYYFASDTTRAGLRITGTNMDLFSTDTARNHIIVVDIANVALPEPTMIITSQYRGDANAAQIYSMIRHNQLVAYDGFSLAFGTAPTLATMDIFGWTKG